MPKRSKEDTLITINTILDSACRQLLELGYDKMSYTTLSKETGISRTGISHHFPKKTDFTSALEGRLIKLAVEQLDTTTSLPALSSSWTDALSNSRFMSVFKLVFHHSIMSCDDCDFSHRFIEKIITLIVHELGEEARKEVEWMIGRTLITMTR